MVEGKTGYIIDDEALTRLLTILVSKCKEVFALKSYIPDNSSLERELKQYTDDQILTLIKDAPEGMDTFKEVSDKFGSTDAAIKALQDLIATKVDNNTFDEHIESRNNPHGVTASQLGLGKVENKSSEIIRGELTADNVKTALGYTPLESVDNATSSAAGLMSADDKAKLDSISEGAEVNQNAFSNVVVGSTTVSADNKTDTLTLVAGTNVTITPDATNDNITIAAKDTTYSVATQSDAGLMSADDKAKLDGIAIGAKPGTITGVSVNGTSVATSGVANITSVPASILSGAIPSGVTATTQSANDSSTKIATTAYVTNAINALADPMVFMGTVGTDGTITKLPTASAANKGYTYKVITNGTYASIAAKNGDTFISDGSAWVLIPSGDEPSGTNTSVTLKATSPIAIDSTAAITSSGSRTISHANSGVTAATYGTNNATALTPKFGETFTVNGFAVNASGHITSATSHTVKIPNAVFTKSGSGAAAGLVPAPSTTAGTTKYLREDGTWQVPPDNNTTYSDMTGATSSAAGTHGLVPAPAAGKQTSFLRGDGTWVVPTYSAATQSANGLLTAADKKILDSTCKFATCATTRATAAKVVTLANFVLQAGSHIFVKFTATDTANPASGNITLNVNNTGAKNVYVSQAYSSFWQATYVHGPFFYNNQVHEFVYDGTQWVMFIGRDNNTTYTNASLGQGYGTCTTAEATAAKVVSLGSYTLTTGGIVAVKFTYGVPASATMNINSRGAKAIYFKGAAITAGVIKAGDTATFVYNGSQYHLLAVDSASDYEPLTTSEIQSIVNAAFA